MSTSDAPAEEVADSSRNLFDSLLEALPRVAVGLVVVAAGYTACPGSSALPSSRG